MPTKRFLVVVGGSDHVENLRGATWRRSPRGVCQ
jgi:hypothetical protein